jgi:effector-binding domain-containing protein
MKIAKYFFLLILLFVTTLLVFVATKDSNYFVKRTKIINIPKATVFNYISEFKNWETFGPWKKQDPSIKFIFPEKTTGLNSYYTWTGKDGEGKIKTVFVAENDSIIQDMTFNGSESKTSWIFKDTLKGTKITWTNKGKLGFTEKLFLFTLGGVDKIMGKMFEDGLSNLDTILTTTPAIDTYKITIDGFVRRDTVYYIQRPLTCLPEELPKKIKTILPVLSKFLYSTGTQTNGSPFIVYHPKNNLNKKILFSIAIPTKEKIYTSAESDIVTGQTNDYQAVKATLTGDYIHKKEAYDQLYEYMTKNKLEKSPKNKITEIIIKNSVTEAKPSNWITEIYIPVRPKKLVISVKPVKNSTQNKLIESNFKDTIK